MQLLLTEDQHVIQALSPDSPQKAFTDRIGAWRVIGRFQELDAARRCNTSETGSKLALMITDEILLPPGPSRSCQKHQEASIPLGAHWSFALSTKDDKLLA